MNAAFVHLLKATIIKNGWPDLLGFVFQNDACLNKPWIILFVARVEPDFFIFQEEILQSEKEKRASKSKSRRKRKRNESDADADVDGNAANGSTAEAKLNSGDGTEPKKKKKRRKKKAKAPEVQATEVRFRFCLNNFFCLDGVPILRQQNVFLNIWPAGPSPFKIWSIR